MITAAKYCPVCKHPLEKIQGRDYCPDCKSFFFIQVELTSVDSPLLREDAELE